MNLKAYMAATSHLGGNRMFFNFPFGDVSSVLLLTPLMAHLWFVSGVCVYVSKDRLMLGV